MVIHYKVRNKNTGLYSTGGSYGWSKQGKTFDTLGKLRSFLTRCFNSNYARQFIAEFEIEEFEVRHSATKGVHEVMDPKKLFGLISKEY
jgi:hypothetical protein